MDMEPGGIADGAHQLGAKPGRPACGIEPGEGQCIGFQRDLHHRRAELPPVAPGVRPDRGRQEAGGKGEDQAGARHGRRE